MHCIGFRTKAANTACFWADLRLSLSFGLFLLGVVPFAQAEQIEPFSPAQARLADIVVPNVVSDVNVEAADTSVKTTHTLGITWQSELLQQRLESYGITQRLQDFVQTSFKLDANIEIIFAQKELLKIEHELGLIYLPASLWQSLESKLSEYYPEQGEPVEALVAATFEQVLWQQFGKLLFARLGRADALVDSYMLDSFVNVMLLNLDDNHLLLDAVEIFLLVDAAAKARHGQNRSEAQQIQHSRYQRIACLVLGKDYQPFSELIDELTWSHEQLNSCQQAYRRSLADWKVLLAPRLQQDAPLLDW